MLRKKPGQRLGSSPNGGHEIRTSAFFTSIDFDALDRREVAPPFTPDVKSDVDTAYVPAALLQADPTDSAISAQQRKKRPTQVVAESSKVERAVEQQPTLQQQPLLLSQGEREDVPEAGARIGADFP